MADDTHPPTRPLASLGDVLFVLSSWHLCVPHYLPFPKMGAVVYRNCFTSHFPEGKPKAQREAALTQGQVSHLWHCCGQVTVALPAPALEE